MFAQTACQKMTRRVVLYALVYFLNPLVLNFEFLFPVL